jgi:preprotein translocase subunit SecA
MKLGDVADTVAEMRGDVLALMVAARVPEKAFSEQWQLTELATDVERVFNISLPIDDWGKEDGIDETHLRERIEQAVDEMMAAKAANMGPDLMRFIEKSLLIQTLDAVWKEHLYALDHLRQGIGLRAYGQRDPLNEYKSEAFALFNAMLAELKERVTSMLARVELAPERPLAPPPMMQMIESHAEPESALSSDLALAEPAMPPRIVTTAPNRTRAVDPNDESTWAATPRNAPCPCGSGKKYKHCHGRLA